MKTEILIDKPLEKEILLTLEKEKLQKDFQEALEKKGANLKIKGFRPGKAPREMLVQQYGVQEFAKVVKDQVQEYIHQFVAQNNPSFLERPLYEIQQNEADALDLENLSDIRVVLKLFLKPEISPIDFQKVVLEDPKIFIPEDFAKEKMQAYAAGFKTSIPLEEKRPAQKGDTLVYKMEYQSSDGQGQKIEGEFELGSSAFPKEFEDMLEGIEEGYSVVEKLRVPKNFPDEKMAGKKVAFQVSFSEIRQTVASSLNEDFAKKQGFQSLQEFEEHFKKTALEQLKKVLSENFKKKQLRSYLNQNLSFDVPENWFSQKHQSYWNHLRKQFENLSEQDKSAKLKELFGTEKEEEAFAKSKENMLIATRKDLFLEEMAKEKNVRLLQKEWEMFVENAAVKSGLSLEQMVNLLKQMPEQTQAIQKNLIEDKVLSLLALECALQDKEIIVNDLIDLLKENETQEGASEDLLNLESLE